MATAVDLNALADEFVGSAATRPAKPTPSPKLAQPRTPPHPLANPASAEFRAMAQKYGHDPDEIARLMRAESAFNPNAESPKGAQGLLQLMPSVQQDYGVTDPMDPAQNVPAAMQYLRDLKKRFKGDSQLAYAAWSAGPGTVEKLGRVPNYPETQNLIAKVLPGGGTGPAPVTLSPADIERMANEFVGTSGAPVAPAGVPPTPPVAQSPVPMQPYADVPGYPAPRQQVQAGAVMPGPTLGAPGMQQWPPAGKTVAAEPPSLDRPAQRPAPLGAKMVGPPTPTRTQLAYQEELTRAREAGEPVPPPRDEPLEEVGPYGAIDLGYGLRQGGEIVGRQVKNLAHLWGKFHSLIDPMGRTAISQDQMPAKLEQAAQQAVEYLRVNPEAMQDRNRFDQVLFRAVGQFIPQIAEYMVLKPLLGPVTALVGPAMATEADQGIGAAAWAGLKAYVLGKVQGVLGQQNPLVAIPSTGALFSATTYAETGDPQQAIVQGLMGMGMTATQAGRTGVREAYQRFSDYVDAELGRRQGRSQGPQGAPPAGVPWTKEQVLHDATQGFRESRSQADVESMLRQKHSMDPETARNAARMAYDLYVEATKKGFGVGGEDAPPAGGTPPPGTPPPSPPPGGPGAEAPPPPGPTPGPQPQPRPGAGPSGTAVTPRPARPPRLPATQQDAAVSAMNLPSDIDTLARQGLARPMAPEEEAWITRMLEDLDPSKPAPTVPPEPPGQQAQLVPWARQELLIEGPGVPTNEPLSEQERFDAQYAAPGPATFPAPSYRPPGPDNIVPSPEEVVPGRPRVGRAPEEMRKLQEYLDVWWRHFMVGGDKPAMGPRVFTRTAEAFQKQIREMQAEHGNNADPAVQHQLQSFQDYSRRIDQAVEREMQARKQARLAQPEGMVEAEVETPAVVPQPEPPVPPTPAVAVATPPRTAPSLVTPIEDIGGPQRPTPPPVPRRAALDPREDFTQEASVLNRPPADVWNMLRDEYATSPSREDGRVALQKAGIPSQPGDRLVDIAYGALARGEDLFPPPVAQEVPLPPPPGPGMVRLYRGSSTKSIPLPPWLDADPKFQATKHATGRWWTDNLAIAKWYYDDAAPTAKIEYVDVPEAVAQQGRLRQQPPEIQRFSLDPDNEYFLPAPYAGRGAPLPASLIPATAQPPQPPTPVAPAPTVPKPVPEATIANSGTPYKSKQNADFALTHKKGISPEHHEVVERPGYGWFIVPKGSAVPKAVEPVAPTEKPSPTPEPPSLYTALTTWGAKVTDAFQLPANERKAQLTTLRQEGVAMRDAAMTSPELVPTFDPQFERFLGMIDAELGKPQSASPAVQTATAASTPLPTRESVLPDQPPPVPVETPAPPAPTAKVAPPSEEAQNAGFQALVREIRHQLFVGGKAIKDIRDLQRLAEAAYGSHRAEGAYDTRDMYDALEVAINQQVREIDFPINKPLDQAIGTAEVLHAFMEKTPTQTLRTAEQDQLQQFSTPLDYAYATAWVANLQPQDLVIEPSAGTGTIANFAAMALGPKNVIVNEIAPRRLEALRMQGYGQITKEDALFLNTILSTRLERHPSVVLMNPPFSIAASQGQHNPKVGANHVEQALRLLADGGRLVAIVGRGMGPETATFREWFDKIGKQHSIRAVIEVDGKVYQKQGTEFGTRIIVIDKGTPTAEGSILTGKVATIPDLLRMLDEVRNVRTITAVVPTPERPDTPETRPGDTPPGNQPTRPTDAVEPHAPKGRPVSPPPQVPRPGPRRDGGVDPGGSGTVAARPGRPRSPSGGRPTPGRPGGAESPGGVPSTLEPPPRPAPAPQPDVPAPERPSERGPERVAPEAPSPSSPRPPETPAGQDAELVDLTTTIFQPYIGANLGIADAQPHPGALVETSAMASVAGPSITVQHHLAPKVITEGRLSIAQLDPVLRARQAHDRLLHNGKRQGFFDGDGTGTGKGRIIAGIIFDNWQEGRTKALWVSKSQDNFAQAQGDWVDVSGRDKHDMFTVHRPNIPHAQPITRESGVLFMPYDTLKGHAKHTPADTRLKQVVEWLGPEFDGVIALDESHLLGNNMADPNEIFGTKVSQRAAAGQQLQDLLPNARVVYLSATGATEVANLGYLDRLGMWGPGTAFATKGEFVNKVASRGIAAMEYVARDLKAMGLYAARSLSFADVRYERLEVELSPAQMASYDRIAAAWREVTKNIEEALTTTGGKGSMQERNAMNLFWSTQQRFFNQLITSLKTPAVIADMDTYINDPNGGAAIIQLTNTNESTQKRRLAQLQEDEDLEDLTLSPMDILMDYIQTSFPVGAQTPKLQDDGTVVMVPLTDSEGRPVESPEAVAIRDKMIDEMAQLQADIPDGPLEQIIDHFGVDQVAEITGRKQRLIYKEDASGKMVRTRETGRTDRHIAQDLSDFRDDKKRILVFSGKGDTGMDYHAGLKFKNQRQRYHYPLQPGWRADMTVQGLGRSHRTNQASAPIYRLPSTNLPAEKRFISSIARRLDQLGALTRGQRQASAQGLFSERDNLETAYAEDALYRLLRDIQVGRNVSIGPTEFLEATGLDVTTQKGLDATIPRFLNRLFMFPFAVQNSVFNDFSARLDDVIEAAIQSGTYETGVETIRADRVTKMREEVIATHEGTGAETSYIELKVENKPRPTAWDKLQARIQTLLHTERGSSLKGYAQNNRSKRVYAIMDTLPDVDKKTGNLIPRLRLIGILNEGKELAADLTKEKYTLVPEDQAQQLWTQNITALPEYLSHTEHLITGLLMPHWDKLENIATKVQQVFTNDGDRLLGLVVPPSQLKAVMQNFGVTLGEDAPALPSYSPEAAIDRVLTNGSTFRVSNGWHLAPSRIGGQSRVELKHVTSAQARNLEADGVVYERVGYTAHYFLPTGPRGQDVYRRVMVGKQLAQEFAKGEKVDD